MNKIKPLDIQNKVRDATNNIKAQNTMSIYEHEPDLSALIEEVNFGVLWELNYVNRNLYHGFKNA